MRPDTSVRQPILAAARRRPLADLLRTWRSQPRKRSPRLFWGLIVLAFLLNTDIVLVSLSLLGHGTGEAERPLPVPYVNNAALWQPLRGWVIHVEGRPQLFESFCREAVRALTGREQFRDADPLAVVVSWMLHDAAAWAEYPFLYCDDPELRGLLVGDERAVPRSLQAEQFGPYLEPVVLRRSREFRKLLRGIAVKNASGLASALSPLERRALELHDRLALYDHLHSDEMESMRKALTAAYHSGSAEVFAVALTDFLDASGHAHPEDEDAAAVTRLTCEDWYNRHHPFVQASYCSLLAAIFLALGFLAGERRPFLRRGLLVSGLTAGVGCLGWALAGFVCRTIEQGSARVSNSQDGALWIAALALGLGLVLALRQREVCTALAGALAASVAFLLAERWLPALPVAAAGNAGANVHLLVVLSAYAALALAWSAALLTLGRLILAPLSGEQLRRLARPCGVALAIAAALLAVGAIAGPFRLARASEENAAGLATLLALPCCVALLYARRVGWVQSFGLIVGAVLCFTVMLMTWCSVLSPGTWARHPGLALARNPWLYWAAFVNLSLIVHAALRYYFGRQPV